MPLRSVKRIKRDSERTTRTDRVPRRQTFPVLENSYISWMSIKSGLDESVVVAHGLVRDPHVQVDVNRQKEVVDRMEGIMVRALEGLASTGVALEELDGKSSNRQDAVNGGKSEDSSRVLLDVVEEGVDDTLSREQSLILVRQAEDAA